MIGRTLSSRYQVTAKLGEGGIGTVYKAFDTNLDRTVAIKVLREENIATAERRLRFVQEAKAASALNHPNIVTVYDIDQDDSTYFLVMEHVVGSPLDQLKSMSPRQRLQLALQIADALSAAHSAGIVHRDVKPHNIMVTTGGLVKVLDFGLAKLVQRGDSTDPEATQTMQNQGCETAFMGTIAYVSPEQAEGRSVDSRSDIFSFGLVLYEMLVGRHPFVAESVISTLSGILNRRPQPLPSEIPHDVQQIVYRCLQKNPDQRFQTMKDVKIALERYLDQSSSIAASNQDSKHGIAVLPFVNLNRDPEGEFFSDGLTEELIATLSQSEGLRVISQTSISRFKNIAEDVWDLGGSLGVTAIVEGSVRRVDKRWRIAARLIDVVRGHNLWSQQFDRDVADILAIQEELAKGIVQALSSKLASP
jgi:serine/threonine protein kinase